MMAPNKKLLEAAVGVTNINPTPPAGKIITSTLPPKLPKKH